MHIPARALLARLGDAGLRAERVSYCARRAGRLRLACTAWSALLGGVDLYDAIRRPEARRFPLTARNRAALAAAVALTPAAALLAAAEVAARRGGTVYVEARA